MPQANKNTLIIWALFLIYISFLSAHIPHIPQADDFDLILLPLIELHNCHSFSACIESLFSPHNEHISAFPKILLFFFASSFPSENLLFLLCLSSTLLLSCFATRILSTKESQILPLALLFLTPVYSEIFTFPSAAITIGIGLSLSLLGISYFTQGNSILKKSLGISFLILSCLNTAAGGIALISLLVYPLLRSFLFPLLGALCMGILFVAFPEQACFFLSLLGSAFCFDSYTASLRLGGILYGVFLFQSRNLSYSSCALCVFLLGTALAISYGRAESGLEHSYLTSRYKIISVILAVILLKKCLKSFQSQYIMIASYACAMIYCFFAHIYYLPELTHRTILLEDSLQRYQLFNEGLLHPSSAHAATIIEEAISSEYWKPPQISSLVRSLQAHDKIRIDCTPGGMGNIESSNVSDSHIYLSGWAFQRPKIASRIEEKSSFQKRSIEICLKDKNEVSHCAKANTRLRPDLHKHFRKQKFANRSLYGGFSIFIKRPKLLQSQHQLTAYIQQDDTTYCKKLGIINLK